MMNRKSVLTACAVVVAGLLMAVSTQAWTVSRTNYLTFNKAVALPDAVLTPGTYTFERVPGSIDIVRVTSRDGKRALYMGFTQTVTRPVGMPKDRTVTFGEAPEGEPTPIAAWFPIGSESGHRFLYR